MLRPIKVRFNKIASSTRNAKLSKESLVTHNITCKEGYILAVKVMENKKYSDCIEDVYGRMVRLRWGDILAGVIGHRSALKGYVGCVPNSIVSGDVIQILNEGGILGRCVSDNYDMGPPFNVEVIGSVLSYKNGKLYNPANIFDGQVKCSNSLKCKKPLILVAGTSIDTGKTTAVVEIIRGLIKSGLKVAGVKFTGGVSLRKDVYSMLDVGAIAIHTFTDTGILCTTDANALVSAYGLLNHLSSYDPDIIVGELGDGLLGDYGTMTILNDRNIRNILLSVVCCTQDLVGSMGAVNILRNTGVPLSAISGPVTDSVVGCNYIKNLFNISALNAKRDGSGLSSLILGIISERIPEICDTTLLDLTDLVEESF